MNEAVHKLNVLVTRPVHQSKRLSRLIEQAGGVAHAVPVIEILPAAHPDEVQRNIGDLHQYDLFIFVSTNAVRHGRDYFPVGASLPGTVAAVGPTTAQALERAGLGCDVKPRRGYSSEDLLAEPRLQDVDGQKVVIFRGSGGRALLGDTLAERGANVTYANVYRRRPPPASARKIHDFLAAGGIDLITATSVETLCNIDDMAGEDQRAKLRGLTVLTASPRVVKKAAELGFERDALLARGPDDKSLVAAIRDWRDNSRTSAGERSDQRAAEQNLAENDDMASDDKQDRGDRIHAYQKKTRASQRDADTPAGEQANAGADDKADEADAEALAKSAGEIANEAATPESTTPNNEPQSPKERADEPAKQDVADSVSNSNASAPVATKPAKSGRGLAALAILLALLAGAASGYNWWRGLGVRASLDEVSASVPDEGAIIARARQETERAGNEITRSVDDRLSRVDLTAVEDLRAGQDRLDGSLRGQQRSVSTLTDRLSGLEEDISAMRGVSASVRNTWVRAEAEYFLQTANSRLQLANDIDSALHAMRAADERIGALGDPGLTPVRALLTEEILSVESVPRPDIQGMALVLNGMTARVRELPFRTSTPDNFAIERPGDTDTPNGWGRAKEAVTDVFTGIVRVSPSDGTSTALLAPQESWFLVRNLELQLQVARAALMEKDVENFRGSMQTAIKWLGDYFEPDDQAVRSMLGRLADMEQVDIDPTVPDISGSLRLLREIVAESSASQ